MGDGVEHREDDRNVNGIPELAREKGAMVLKDVEEYFQGALSDG